MVKVKPRTTLLNTVGEDEFQNSFMVGDVPHWIRIEILHEMVLGVCHFEEEHKIKTIEQQGYGLMGPYGPLWGLMGRYGNLF